MSRVLAAAVAATLLLAACSSGSPSHQSTPTITDTSSGAGSSADQIADSYNRAADNWVADVENGVDAVSAYPDQLSTKQATAAQLTAAQNYCAGAQKALTKVEVPPVLDNAADAATSITYRSAVNRDKTLRAHAQNVQAQLEAFERFCTWLDAFESGQPASAKASGTLFAAPLRYTGTVTVGGKQHSCPAGSSCYSPDQSLWPQMAKLWRQEGAAVAEGAKKIKAQKIGCLIKGWEKMCDLVVQNQLDYESWADAYANAFEDNKDKTLPVANTELSRTAAELQTTVLVPLSALPGIYRQLAPAEKYDSRVSSTGVNIWIDEITGIVTAMKAATKTL